MSEWKEYKSRVVLEIIFNVYTSGRTEEEAGRASEDMIDDVAKHLKTQLENADGLNLPSPSECWMATWGVRNVDIEEREEDE